MGCKEFEVLLSAYTNGELSSEEIESVERHLAVCPDCKASLKNFQEVRQQVLSLKDAMVTVDITDTVMTKIKGIKDISPARRWLRRSLVAVPAALLLIALLIIEPWSTIPGFNETMAKSYLAVEALRSYRTELTLTLPFPTGDKTTVIELTYSAPDRYYTKKMENETADETIKIGNQTFYRTIKDGVVPEVVNPDSSGLAPDMGKTFSLLNTLHELKSLGIETIDGVNCYHYRGNFYSASGRAQTVHIWIGIDDNLPRKQTQGDYYTVRFFDFNQPIVIEPPLSSAGELQEGWQLLKSEPRLNVNFMSSIGGIDLTHSLIKYEITITNDGLQEAKNVILTLQTEATNNPDKPLNLEVMPLNNVYPVNIPSWQSITYRIEWEYDAGNMSKLELAKLVEQTTLTVSYYTEDGTEVIRTYPEK